MTPDELEQARLGFSQLLRRKGLSRQFIERNADELLATAALEYSRKLAEGEEIESPAAWLVSCAWQRTKDQLRVEVRHPAAASTEDCEPVEETRQGPEDVLLDEDRFRKVRDAVKELPIRQQRLLALSYFEGLTVRQAARELHWHPSRAQRAHEGARRKLHDLLGVSSADDLEIEIGLAAFLSLAAGSNGSVLERAAQRSAETLASFKQQAGEAGAQLKQHASTAYYRAVDPTPLAAARPGTVAAVLASCVAITGSAATYCAEQGMNPLGAARSLIASTDEPEAPPTEGSDPEPQAPTYTPAEPTPSETAPPPEAVEAPEPPPKPEPEKSPPVSDNYEPVHPRYMAQSEEEPTPTYEDPDEPAPVEGSSREPAPIPTGSGPQFGGPGGP